MKTKYQVITEWQTGFTKVLNTCDTKEEADKHLLAHHIYCLLKNINTSTTKTYVKEVNQ
jgi:hypothetical protein